MEEIQEDLFSGGDALSDELTTSEASKFKTYYLKNIRPHADRDTIGVIRQILTLVNKKGIKPMQIKTALENYASYKCDPRLRKHIRSFFTSIEIMNWQTPLKLGRRSDYQIERLEQIESTVEPPRSAATKPLKTEDEDALGEF